jgi:hypothetical protein
VAAVLDLHPHHLRVCAHGYGDGLGRAAAVTDGVGDELAGEKLRVAEPRLTDQLQGSVERRQSSARGGGRLAAIGQLEPQQCTVVVHYGHR